MNMAGLEPSNSSTERSQTNVLDRAATGINTCDSHFDFFLNIVKRLAFYEHVPCFLDVIADILWAICINTSNPRVNKIGSSNVSLFLDN